jgi:hypothetical protein
VNEFTTIGIGRKPFSSRAVPGNPADPAAEHRGGSLAKTGHGHRCRHDSPGPVLKDHGKNGAHAAGRWRKAYLRDRQKPME